jgi:hypothetical protein
MLATLAEIQTYAAKELLVPEQQQIIIIGGERVVGQANATLQSLGLEDNSMIFLTYEMRGGGKQVKNQQLKGTAPAGAGARRKAKQQDDDDEGEGDETVTVQKSDDMADEGKDQEMFKRIGMNMVVIKSARDGSIFKRHTDAMEEFLKFVSDGEAESVFIKFLETVPTPKLKAMFDLSPASARNLSWLQSHLSKTYFHAEFVNAANELKEHSDLVISTMANMVGCAYLKRYGKVGKATYGAMAKDIVAVLERRAVPAAAPQGFLGRVFHHV